MSRITIEQLFARYRIDADTGEIFSIAGRDIGRKVGSLHWNGYIRCSVNRVSIGAHRVIFAMAHGRWPVGILDHINGDKTDNRLSNLREATHSQNASNRSPFSSYNKSGFRGVGWHERDQRWQVSINADGVSHYIGQFKELEAAVAAYREASARLHGEFSVTRRVA